MSLSWCAHRFFGHHSMHLAHAEAKLLGVWQPAPGEWAPGGGGGGAQRVGFAEFLAFRLLAGLTC